MLLLRSDIYATHFTATLEVKNLPSTYIARRLGVQPHKSLASSQGFGTTMGRLAVTNAIPGETLVADGEVTTPLLALNKEHRMKYLRDNSDSKHSDDSVDEDPVDMVLSAIEEGADRGTVMPACIFGMSLRSLVFIPTTVCPDFVFFIGSSVGCTRWILEGGREGGMEGGGLDVGDRSCSIH